MTSLINTISRLVDESETYLSMNRDKIWWIDSPTSLQSDWIDLPHRGCFCDRIVLVSDWPNIDITVVSRKLIGWLEEWNEILEHMWTRIRGNRSTKTGINNSTCFHVGFVNIFFLDGWFLVIYWSWVGCKPFWGKTYQDPVSRRVTKASLWLTVCEARMRSTSIKKSKFNYLWERFYDIHYDGLSKILIKEFPGNLRLRWYIPHSIRRFLHGWPNRRGISLSKFP